MSRFVCALPNTVLSFYHSSLTITHMTGGDPTVPESSKYHRVPWMCLWPSWHVASCDRFVPVQLIASKCTSDTYRLVFNSVNFPVCYNRVCGERLNIWLCTQVEQETKPSAGFALGGANCRRYVSMRDCNAMYSFVAGQTSCQNEVEQQLSTPLCKWKQQTFSLQEDLTVH